MKEDIPIAEAELWFDRGSRRYLPGDLMEGQYDLANWKSVDLQAVELSLLWYTAGQGEEDFCVHHFERHERIDWKKHADNCRFVSILPASPFSYDGKIVKVCWAARLKGFFKRARPRVVEAPFWLVATEEPIESATRDEA